ncbi:uncharacterized protein NECHADRAFT_89419 [Fusarium vanettenii 77-13-4]|uniref:Uncharacterized protein n=1 Tax=Fusarium vanettenii (strain ATCC MYA-4622 / CBS 123669 / FGSC 9596 / NRRL 45880 / 77-13-4) TaxID=660122 RepID=C7ZR51_FUSV7|nr:uncharacterized protein NECHADRAFT_89533 [Fusarium vanettenii 77-13-4]XP_003039221.1 uncharacterized protein NECHADRAFT_89419 [Fusarium vanettenii 77-13-4]EEU33391.1 predicted protein [Fusarium vanettenii 77-13-4]EEU33508.1 predicted protein [Fusarium vanettenii 77-13-4]
MTEWGKIATDNGTTNGAIHVIYRKLNPTSKEVALIDRTIKDPNPRIRHYRATTAYGIEAIGTETALLVAGDREKSAIIPTIIDSDPKGQITRTDKEEGRTKTETGNEETTEAALANRGEEPRR